jgi:hypothetical protein
MNKDRNPQKAIGFVTRLEDFNAGINSRKEMPNQGFKGVIQVEEC